MINIPRCLLVALMLVASVGRAQDSAGTPMSPKTVSPARFGYVSGIRVLSDGRVFVNDGFRRRIVLLDSAFSEVKVVLDYAAPIHSRGLFRGTGSITAFRGDSSILVDGNTQSVQVIDPSGFVVRRLDTPRDLFSPRTTLGTAIRGPRFDGDQGLIFPVGSEQLSLGVPGDCASPAMRFRADSASRVRPPDDSLAVIRTSVRGRSVDTLGHIAKPKSYGSVCVRDRTGIWLAMPQVDPLAVGDAWTTSSSGDLTFLRMSGWRADRVDREGRSLGSFSIPSPMRTLSDDEKRAARDSLQAYFAKHPLRVLPLPGGGLRAQLIMQVVPLPLLTGMLPSIIPSLIAVDDAGGLWLARAATLPSQPTGAQLFARANAGEYLVVDSNGMISRRVRLPAGAEIQAVVGRDIYATISSTGGLALVRMTLQ